MLAEGGVSNFRSFHFRRKSATDELYELPEHIKALTGSRKKTEDMLSNQMLSGIPEIDLGIEWVPIVYNHCDLTLK